MFCYFVVGIQEIVRNNVRINKWDEIYIPKCAREFFFFMLGQRAIEEAVMLNVYFMILDNLFRAILHAYDGSYLPTPPLGQDVTQVQFLSGV